MCLYVSGLCKSLMYFYYYLYLNDKSVMSLRHSCTTDDSVKWFALLKRDGAMCMKGLKIPFIFESMTTLENSQICAK